MNIDLLLADALCSRKATTRELYEDGTICPHKGNALSVDSWRIDDNKWIIDSIIYSTPPAFSTSWMYAETLIKLLREKGWRIEDARCQVDRLGIEKDQWEVILSTIHPDNPDEPKEKHHIYHWKEGEATTFPMALSVAALGALDLWQESYETDEVNCNSGHNNEY